MLLVAVVAFFSPTRHVLPRLTPLLRAAAGIDPQTYTARWHVASADTQQGILCRYFGVDVDKGTTVELFCIDNVPTAALCWNTTNAHGQPIVSSIHVNKGLMLLFDAGTTMRFLLWQRYPSLSFRNTTEGVLEFYAI